MTQLSLGSVQNTRPLLMVKLQDSWCKQMFILSSFSSLLKRMFLLSLHVYLHYSRDVAASVRHLVSVLHRMLLMAGAHFLHILQTAVIIGHWRSRNPVEWSQKSSGLQCHHIICTTLTSIKLSKSIKKQLTQSGNAKAAEQGNKYTARPVHAGT